MELGQILAAVALAFTISGVICAFLAIWETRTTQGAIAWAISLVTFPYLAVPLYLVFGRRKFQGYVAARRKAEGAVRQASGLAPMAFTDADRLSRHTLGQIQVAETLAQMPFTLGNEAKLLVDGEAIFDAILAAVDEAESYLLVQFYIFRDDGLGRRFAQKLAEAAQRGVKVRLLYDEIGSNATSKAFFARLREQGVAVSPFRSTGGRGNRFQLNFRNHRKIVVADGETAFIGGANVGDEYLGLDPKIGPWRDTHVQLRGPVVQAAQLAFEEDWYWAAGEVLELDWRLRAANGSDQVALILATGPADKQESCALLFVQAINSALERIWIVSPYFVPDLDVMAALRLAALRGVDVRIMVPEKADHLIVWLATYACMEDAADDGIRFFRYEEGFLHQKVMLIDGKAASVGTANMDNRSFRLNFEITALIADPGFCEEVEEMLTSDFARCREYMPGELKAKPLPFQLAVRVALLASPIL
ncbi:cardiolipin synthase [Limibacillus halophilus]